MICFAKHTSEREEEEEEETIGMWDSDRNIGQPPDLCFDWN